MTTTLSTADYTRVQKLTDTASQRGWFVTDQLIGSGGGADVVLTVRGDDLAVVQLALPGSAGGSGPRVAGPATGAAQLIQFLAERMIARQDVLAAIKIPKRPEERIRTEIKAMEECRHANLVRLLDKDPGGSAPPAWFIMEYFPFGTIESHRKDFHGKPLGTLRAIRGAVEAVSELNKKNYFHRDIKPNNIFVAGDGRWVLGDLGIALHPENTAHTAPGHQLFSRDWIPDWCVDFPDRYDAVAEVHTLAKTILYMVSGKKPRASSMPDIDLVAEFPNTPGMRDLQELLRAEIKSRKDETASKTATDFLAHVDRVIDRLTRPALPTLLFSYLNAAGQPFANVDNTRIYSVTRTRQLIAAFKFRADSGQGSGRFKYGLKDIGISNPIEVENPPPQGDWVVHHMIHLQSDLEPGWYTLVLDTSMLGRVQLIGAMIYG